MCQSFWKENRFFSKRFSKQRSILNAYFRFVNWLFLCISVCGSILYEGCFKVKQIWAKYQYVWNLLKMWWKNIGKCQNMLKNMAKKNEPSATLFRAYNFAREQKWSLGSSPMQSIYLFSNLDTIFGFGNTRPMMLRSGINPYSVLSRRTSSAAQFSWGPFLGRTIWAILVRASRVTRSPQLLVAPGSVFFQKLGTRSLFHGRWFHTLCLSNVVAFNELFIYPHTVSILRP